MEDVRAYRRGPGCATKKLSYLLGVDDAVGVVENGLHYPNVGTKIQ